MTEHADARSETAPAEEQEPLKPELEDLEKELFVGQEGSTIAPTQEEIDGFETFAAHSRAGLDIERTAVRDMNW